VKGFSGAKFRSFATKEEAQDFVDKNSIQSPGSQEELPSQPAKKRRRVADHKIMITIHFDGGSRGNPGIAGAGAQVAVTQQTPTSQKSEYIRIRKFLGSGITNNEAEYQALLAGLDQAVIQIKNLVKKYEGEECEATVRIRGDSDLVVQQIQDKYQVKSPNLQPLHRAVKKVINQLSSIVSLEMDYAHVYRSENSVADGKNTIKRILLGMQHFLDSFFIVGNLKLALANEAMDELRSWTTSESTNPNVNGGILVDV
jgi:ribonuclease HI